MPAAPARAVAAPTAEVVVVVAVAARFRPSSTTRVTARARPSTCRLAREIRFSIRRLSCLPRPGALALTGALAGVALAGVAVLPHPVLGQSSSQVVAAGRAGRAFPAVCVPPHPMVRAQAPGVLLGPMGLGTMAPTEP